MSALLRRIRSLRTLTRAATYSNHPRPTKTDELDSEAPPTPKVGDIGGREYSKSLAPYVQRNLVENIGGREYSKSLAPDVQRHLISSSCKSLVRKKTALCLICLFIKNPNVVNIDGWSDRMAPFLDERDLGVLTSFMSFLTALVSSSAEAYSNCMPKCVKVLERIASNHDIPQDYTYYGIPSTWVQVGNIGREYSKSLAPDVQRHLVGYIIASCLLSENHYFLRMVINAVQNEIVGRNETFKFIGLTMIKTMRALQYFPAVEDPNTRRALFEVMHLDAEKMTSQFVAIIGKIISVRESNIWYLCLENITRMVLVTDMQDGIRRRQAHIITSLQDPDIRFDAILQLIGKSGDFVSADIWYRVVQFVTSSEDLQLYAAAKAREYLDKSILHETMLKMRGTFCIAFRFFQGIMIGCDSRITAGIKHMLTGYGDYLRVDTIDKLEILNEDICFMLAGDDEGCLKYSKLVRQADFVLKPRDSSHLPCNYAEDIISYVDRMIHDLEEENLGGLDEIIAIFVDRRRDRRSLISYTLNRSISYDDENFMKTEFHDCMAIGFNIHMYDLVLQVRFEEIATFTEALEFCCVAANIAYTFDKACGDDFKVYFANREVPWSCIPHCVKTMADILKYGPCLGYSTHPRIDFYEPHDTYIYDTDAVPYDERDYDSAFVRERGKLFVKGKFVQVLPRLWRDPKISR